VDFPAFETDRGQSIMRILVTGHRGQLGRELTSRLPDAAGFDLPEGDISDPKSIDAAVDAARPDVIIHCAAMTNVDGAAKDPALAYAINGRGSQNVAQAAARVDAALVYISTNEVFDGTQSEPYYEFDTPHPGNGYGRSKLAGEWFTAHLSSRFYVVRTSWLSAAGGRNFVHRIMQLADERGRLQVVTDEVANPTFVKDLADGVLRLVETGRYGIYHLTGAGYCSRYEYAKRILELTGRAHIPVEPITLAQYPRPSSPPKFGALANVAAASLGIELPPWDESLQSFLKGQ
jgi:dTDP-4-dehydrorhamnose reductase